MIIGVDAGALSITDERLRVGVWRVTYNLLRELAKIDKTNEYRLYTFLPIDRGVMADFGPRMQNVIVRPRIGWASIQLPIELRRHPVDLFLGLSQMLPYSPSRSIGFIYDLGFLHFPFAYPGSLKRLENQTKQLVKRADKIIAISEVTKEDVVNTYQVAKKDVMVAYPGVDSRFAPRGSKHKEKNPYFLFVGALKRGKNVPFALRVFKQFLGHSDKKYDFVIVGGNFWEDPEIAKIITRMDLTDAVKVKNFVADRDVPAYYRGAEAILATSLWEGFCLPAVEAMASGCPVVYAKTGSLPEIIGNVGLGFTPGSEKQMLQAMSDVSSNKILRSRLIAAGKKRSAAFRWSLFARTVYRTILSSDEHAASV